MQRSGSEIIPSTPASSLPELLGYPSSRLDQCDIALLNILAAQHLPGSENLNVPAALARIDAMAARVSAETRRHYYRFAENRSEFNHSEGYFRMLLLAVTLQQDYGIRYNPARITPVGEFEPNQVFFADSRDIFIHGAIEDGGSMGTCASLPVLYVAVGRRLGYPLKLVPARNHLFIRWQDSRERFNVDATGQGMNLHDDEYYRRWPLPISAEEERRFGYLKSMTAAEEVAAFLSLRGHCLLAAGRGDEALAAHEAALRFNPDSEYQKVILAITQRHANARATVSLLPPESMYAASRRDPRRRVQYVLPGERNPLSPQ